jgi:hypothetical protein
MSFDPRRYSLALPNRHALTFLTLLTLFAAPISSQKPVEASAGLAWQVRGSWQLDGKGAPILTGDYIRAGSLLRPGSLQQPGAGAANNSITVLLFDGQLILYECFTTEDCSRGFRVPSLYRTPELLAIDMLSRIHEALAASVIELAVGSTTPQGSRLPRDEQVAVLDPDKRVHVEGLAARLSNGHYTYDIRPFDRAQPREFHLAIEKNGPSITLSLPSSGLYFVTITDSLKTPRIDLFIAAFEPARAANVGKSYREAAALMKEWNTYYRGWPVHDFQRAYLESFMLSANALPIDRRAAATGKVASHPELSGGLADTTENQTGVTAEPAFSPKPGLFDTGMAITLQCKTPGATMHFTVDGSEPVAGSPVYHAPIMLKRTELIIKSFASVARSKDSAVVTGIFRIKEQP